MLNKLTSTFLLSNSQNGGKHSAFELGTGHFGNIYAREKKRIIAALTRKFFISGYLGVGVVLHRCRFFSSAPPSRVSFFGCSEQIFDFLAQSVSVLFASSLA
jgi:hypothetical protein